MDNVEDSDSETRTGIYSNDNGVVESYFTFYSKLLNQQNMLQDYTRTNSYYSAIQNNLYFIYFYKNI